MLDIDEWPKGTDEILVFLLKQEDKEGTGGWENRGRIARATSLNKEQVRYRVEKLVNANQLDKDHVDMGDQVFAVYSLLEDARKTAQAIRECTDILGKVPDEPTQDDILHLTYEISSVRSGYDLAADGDPVPEYIVEIQEHVDKLYDLADRCEKSEDLLDRIVEGMLKIDEWSNNIAARTTSLEERLDEVENRVGS